MASPTVVDAATTSASSSSAGSVDAIYDAPYTIFVYAAWVGSGLLVGDTFALAVLIVATATLTVAGVMQRPPFRPHSFAADLSAILLFCGAAIGTGWFVVQGLVAAPLITVLAVGAATTAGLALGMTPERG